MELVYFSWSGNTRKVFECISAELEKRGFSVKVQEIKPKRDFPYLVWLFLSFIPGVGVKINPIEVSSDIFFLGMPKWTFNCPPITTFLNKVDLRGKTVFLVITYGGFDEERYTKSMVEEIEKKDARIPKILLIKRKKIESGEYKTIVSRWIDEIEGLLKRIKDFH
jgi:flavodoxin